MFHCYELNCNFKLQDSTVYERQSIQLHGGKLNTYTSWASLKMQMVKGRNCKTVKAVTLPFCSI